MKILKLLFVAIGLSFFLHSCSSFSEAGKVLRNEKVNSSDEFLIKKKEPLTQPPEYDVIPQPGSAVNNRLSKKTSIEKLMKNSKMKTSNSQSKPSSTENSILNKIRK